MTTTTQHPETNADVSGTRAPLVALRAASALWLIWGVFHVFIGVALIAFLQGEHPTGDLSSIPEVLDVEMLGSDSTFAAIANLKQHAFNLAWIGLIVTIAAIYVWKANPLAIATIVVVGGLADLGYFVFLDLGGFAEPPGPQMTYIMATAIALSAYAYLSTNKLTDLHPPNKRQPTEHNRI